MSTPRWLYAWGLGSVTLGGVSLLLPLYVVELGGEPFTLGVLAALAAVAGAPGAFLFGRIADRTGRSRGLVLAALSFTTAVALLVPFTESVPIAIAANTVVWFCFAAVGPVLTLLVLAGVEESVWQDRIALLNTVQGWGWAGGLTLGAFWTGIGEQFFAPITAQRVFFLVCAGCSLGAVVGARRYLPTEPDTRSLSLDRVRQALLRARRLNLRGATFPFTPSRLFGWSLQRLTLRALLDRFSLALVVYYGAVLLFFIGFTAFFAPLPIYLEQLGYGSASIFVLYVVSSLGAAMFFIGVATLTRRYNAAALQSTGLLVRGVSIPAVALVGMVAGASTLGFLLQGGLFLVIGLSWAVIAVTAASIVTRMAPAPIRGEALGMYTAVSAVAGGVGSLLGGAVAEISFLLAFTVAGGFVVLGAVLVYRVRGLTRTGPSDVAPPRESAPPGPAAE